MDTVATLTLFYREGCHLCEDMEAQLHELLEPGSFMLRRVDIDEDEQLRQIYHVRVPVLSIGIGSQLQPLCEHFLDLQAVQQALAGYNSPCPDS